MMFSERLKEAAQPLLDDILTHPFVKGIGEGDLPKKALIFYVQQDFLYLNAFMKVDANAILKCETREDIGLFADQINFLLHSEIHPHHHFCKAAGVVYKDLQYGQLAPAAYLYNEHMYNAAREGDLLDILAAMLPCPWTYGEIGRRLVNEEKNTAENRFTPWIEFYAPNISTSDPSFSEMLFQLLDREAEKYGSARRTKAKDRFLKSCELEWRFWDMAYHQQDWTYSLLETAGSRQ